MRLLGYTVVIVVVVVGDGGPPLVGFGDIVNTECFYGR